MNLFSIILPVRNGGEYFKECVGSILNQRYRHFNLIVLDNSSSDQSYEWVSSIGDERIIIYRSEQFLSIEANWGRIKNYPKNEFMTLIGHDDILEPHYLEEMNGLIAKHPTASLYQTHFKYIDARGIKKRSCLPMDEVQSAFEFLACQMNSTIESTGTGYMMRSADFDKLGGMPGHYPNLMFADYELWIKLGNLSYKATSYRECFRYREHDSVSRVTNGMTYLSAFEQYVFFLSSLKEYPAFNNVIDRYGRKMLLDYCQSLSHRLLKTPMSNRNIKVHDLIAKFQGYAEKLIPGQTFRPLQLPKTALASSLDKTLLTRCMFHFYKKLWP